MKSQKIDRRIQRTLQLLIDSLISLILEKGYQKITVQNIIDKANVGRSTFYAHYTDKEDLLASAFESLADDLYQHVEIFHEAREGAKHIVHSMEFFQHAFHHKDFYRAMAESGGGEILIAITRKRIHANIRAHIGDIFGNQETQSIPLPLITNHLATSLLAMISWWTEQETSYSTEEMNEMYEALVMPGFWKIMGND